MASSTAATEAPARPSGLQGRRIVYVAILVFGAMCAAGLLVHGFGEEGVRVAIRATARTTLAVFVAVFCASAVRRRWPGPASHWLMRNRRYLGLAAAVSHAYHLAFILLLSGMATVGADVTTVIGGGWGFVMLFAMAATSNDASQRRLGRRWRQLHVLGVWSVWIIFVVSYFPRAPSSATGAAASAVLVAALLVRIWPHAGRTART